MEIFRTTAKIDEESIELDLSADEDSSSDDVRFVFSFGQPTPSMEPINFSVNLDAETLMFHLPIGHIDPCLVKCGISVVVSALWKCLRPRPANVNAFLQCLKTHGVNIGRDAALCILSCKFGTSVHP
jgi:hypothetical protein